MLTTMMKRKEIKQNFLLLCSKILFMNMVTMTMLNIKRIVIHMTTMLNNNDEKKRKSFLLLWSISYALHGLWWNILIRPTVQTQIIPSYNDHIIAVISNIICTTTSKDIQNMVHCVCRKGKIYWRMTNRTSWGESYWRRKTREQAGETLRLRGVVQMS